MSWENEKSESGGETAEKQGTTEKKEPKKPLKELLAHPAVISLIAIAIILAGSLIIFSVNEAQKLSVFDFQHSSTENLRKPKVIILTSKECPNCESDNSFINTLLKSGIIPLGEEIDADSEEGRELVTVFGIRQVPFVILDARSIDETMQIKTNDGTASLADTLELNLRAELIYKKGDFYLIPEHEQTIMFLDKNSCGSKEKIKVDLYSDPYCAPCALASLSFNQTAKQFASSLDVNYNFYPVDSKKMLFKWEQISPFANYSICAARQGKLFEFQTNAYAYYCNPDQNSYDLNSLQNCEKSSAFRQPLPKDRLLLAFNFAKLDSEELGECLEAIENEKLEMIKTANSFGVFEVPKIVLNCKYSAHAENLEKTICAASPQLEGCKKT